MRVVKERMNLYLTKSVADELRRLAPARERTRFVEEVLARELRRARTKEALARTAGAWKDENHPDLLTFEDVNRWLEALRHGSERDTLKAWGEENE